MTQKKKPAKPSANNENKKKSANKNKVKKKKVAQKNQIQKKNSQKPTKNNQNKQKRSSQNELINHQNISKPQKKQVTVSKRKKRKRPPKKKNPIVVVGGKFLTLVFYLVLFCVAFIALLSVINKDKDYTFFGYMPYTVLTNSMAPQEESPPGGFHAGDLTIVKNATFDQIAAGDIVTYKVGESAYLTHRLIEKKDTENGKQLITKGDANNSQDPPVNGDRLIGKVAFTIPFLGLIIDFIKGHKILAVVFFSSLIGFLSVVRYIIAMK